MRIGRFLKRKPYVLGMVYWYCKFERVGVTLTSIQNVVLKVIQTKKRSSKLGVFSYGTIYCDLANDRTVAKYPVDVL
jgi:hypothetical protein